MVRLLRPTIALLASAACSLSMIAPAAAKAPTHAVLENPGRLAQATAGQRIPVIWTLDTAARLRTPPGHDSALPRGFGGYLRARGADGTAPLTVAARPAAAGVRGYPAGRYLAELTVPRGGVSSIEIGVRATYATDRGPFFAEDPIAIGNDPFAHARGTAGIGADPGRGPPWGVFGAVLAGLALLAAGRALSARRAVA